MIKDIKKKNKEELEKMHADMVIKLRDFRFGIAGSKSRNVKEGRDSKRNIARVLTALKKIKEKTNDK